MEDLSAIYRDLPHVAGTDDAYSTRSIRGRARYKVGRDTAGYPALLVAAEPAPSGAPVLPLEFPNLSFKPRCRCRVSQDGQADSVETFAVLKCTADDVVLQDYFLRCLSGTIELLPEVPSEDRVVGAVSQLAELFRALSAPPRSSLQGLWCELLLLSRAPSIRHAALAWHDVPGDLFDFSSGLQRLEVKSTTGAHRKHSFSLNQLLPQEGTEVVIASFMLRESGGGKTISDLWEEIVERPDLGVELRNRMLQILTMALGRDWRKASRVAFDVDASISELRLFRAESVPRVATDVPVEVSEVHFASELTDVEPIDTQGVAARGGLFAALFSE